MLTLTAGKASVRARARMASVLKKAGRIDVGRAYLQADREPSRFDLSQPCSYSGTAALSADLFDSLAEPHAPT
jgi:hypothetical protein